MKWWCSAGKSLVSLHVTCSLQHLQAGIHCGLALGQMALKADTCDLQLLLALSSCSCCACFSCLGLSELHLQLPTAVAFRCQLHVCSHARGFESFAFVLMVCVPLLPLLHLVIGQRQLPNLHLGMIGDALQPLMQLRPLKLQLLHCSASLLCLVMRLQEAALAICQLDVQPPQLQVVYAVVPG